MIQVPVLSPIPSLKDGMANSKQRKATLSLSWNGSKFPPSISVSVCPPPGGVSGVVDARQTARPGDRDWKLETGTGVAKSFREKSETDQRYINICDPNISSR